ncbi:MAG: hypothetical protein AUK50_07455 [Comamonadaceae bacterium CG2_30_57_122]|nr:MAG: hypothetical protein AUK50_07455 [Comamonadaceae bacterium CG2_30_57_122]PIZ23513.1 MAG: hypothetical protein COY49_02980 [Comamonadaceae bacterium CG_4_10_14_0_8_um_filter_57_29]
MALAFAIKIDHLRSQHQARPSVGILYYSKQPPALMLHGYANTICIELKYARFIASTMEAAGSLSLVVGKLKCFLGSPK